MPEQREPAFGIALDPFRPTDILTPPGVAERPPICPSTMCVAQVDTMVYFLYINNVNQKGDVLLTCLNCGYETVYRVATSKYEPRPGRSPDRWTPPILDIRQAKRVAKGEGTPAPKAARASKKVAEKADRPNKAAVDSGPDYTPKQAAEHARKSLDTLYEAIRMKRLVAFKKDGKTLIKHANLLAYLDKYPTRG